ncbi:hypothetical protein FWF48_01825 [Candidatus Saccharibacteria bacterium]|nr:hypothetical protein [Candidatus Saccharibacteria bacterium]
MSKQKFGDYVIKGGANVWPHEERTAKTLVKAGYTVKFIRKSERERETSADAWVNGKKWEMKAPDGAKLSLVERNLRHGVKQCNRIIFDSQRVKRIPDKALLRELTKWSTEIKGLDKLKFINRKRDIIDIK